MEIVIVIYKLLKRHSKAESRAPAYSRALTIGILYRRLIHTVIIFITQLLKEYTLAKINRNKDDITIAASNWTYDSTDITLSLLITFTGVHNVANAVRAPSARVSASAPPYIYVWSRLSHCLYHLTHALFP